MKHEKEVLFREVGEVDKGLGRPVTVYLIGGGAMGFQDLKAATKDLDGIVDSVQDPAVFAAGLEAAGYKTLTGPSADHVDLGTTRVYAKPDAPQWDLFIEVVCRKLRLSPGIRRRSLWFEAAAGRLNLRLVAPEDIFIFKSITDRQGDIPDLEVLWASGLDWDRVLAEMRWQSAHSERPWAGAFRASMHALDARGRHVPILGELARLEQEEIDEWAVLHVIDRPMTEEEVVEILQKAEKEDIALPVDAAIGRLVDLGRLTRQDGRVTKNRAWRPHTTRSE